MTSAYIADGKPRSVSFTLDEIGQIIRRDESGYISGQTGNPHEVWYRFGRRQLGYTGNNGTSDLSYDASVGDRRVVGPNSPGTFRNQQVTGGAYADFAQNYDPVNSYYQGAAGGTYRVNQGDSLAGIATALYGDSSLWYKIAEANGLSAAAALVEGQTLVLPTGVVKSTNNAGTFKPYNAGEAIGDLSPTTPQPPKKPKCGVFGQILLAVIAIAVTLLLTPASGATFGQLVLGAVAGNVASQAVGVVTGIQDKFSFKGVALAALSAGVGAGVGSVIKGAVAGSKFLGDVVRGALSSGITQGVATATGLQDKFSWAGVAAAGIGAGIGGAVGRGIGGQRVFGQTVNAGDFGYRLATATASGIANAATRSAINGTSFGTNLIAALPDIVAQAIGGTIGGSIKARIDQAGAGVATDPVAQLADIARLDPITQDRLAGDEIVVTGTRRDPDNIDVYAMASIASANRYNAKNRIIQDLHNQHLQAQSLSLPSSRFGRETAADMLSPRGHKDNPNLEGVPVTAAGFTPWQSEHDSRMSIYMATRAAGAASGTVYDPYDHDWVMKGFEEGQAYINRLDAIADRMVWDVAAAGLQPLAFGTGGYRIGINGEHTLENYAAVASPLIGPLAKYAARFGSAGLKAFGKTTSVAAERVAGKFASQGFSPAQAEYLAAPYSASGMGHHFIPRRAGLPSIISDSPLNVLKPNGISRGDFYELHFRVDPKYPGSPLPASHGGGGWYGRQLGLEKYGAVGRLWYGSPATLKVTVGGTVAAGGAAYWYSNDGK